MAVTHIEPPRERRKKPETRQPDFVVRAKTGPSAKDWATIGFAWKRTNGDGFSIKLNALPIGTNWNGVLKLLPPYAEEDDPSWNDTTN